MWKVLKLHWKCSFRVWVESVFHFSSYFTYIVLQLQLYIKKEIFFTLLKQASGTASPHSTEFPQPLERRADRGYWFLQTEKTEKGKCWDERQTIKRRNYFLVTWREKNHSHSLWDICLLLNLRSLLRAQAFPASVYLSSLLSQLLSEFRPWTCVFMFVCMC